MDAEKVGQFIAERRKELGFTQNFLAEKIHVTDKAVSRWERGIGLPDINNIEALANALNVSIIELMQAQRNPNEIISTKEAEELLLDTIQLSKTTNHILKIIGSIILIIFSGISIFLFISSLGWAAPTFSVGSIISGLIAWGIPIWQISLAKKKHNNIAILASMGFAINSLIIEFFNIAYEVNTRDWAAIDDTIHALIIIVVLFSVITLLLNIIMLKFLQHK